MRRSFTFLAIFSLLAIFPLHADETIDQLRNVFLGPVKEVTIKSAVYAQRHGKWVLGESVMEETSIYSKEGNLVERSRYEEGSLLSQEEYIYNIRQNLIEKRILKTDGALKRKTLYIYDGSGALAKAEILDANGLELRRWIYLYDNDKKLIEIDELVDDDLIRKNEYTYEGGGISQIANSIFSSEGELEGMKMTLFDEGGRETEEAFYEGNGCLNWKYMYYYDDRGYLIEIRSLHPDLPALESKSIYTYNEEGNVTLAAVYSSDESLKSKYSYSYDFDFRGNWVVQTESEWVEKFGKSYFEPRSAIYRSIKYY